MSIRGWTSDPKLGARRSGISVPSGAGGFNPLSISGLVAWYEFTDPTTMFTDAGATLVSADGQSIYQINDKSGNGRHLTQATAANRPLYKTGILPSGRSIGRFDGTNDSMAKATSGIVSADDYAQWIVMKPAATSATPQYVFDPFDAGSQVIIYGFEDSVVEAYNTPRVNIGTYDGSNFGVYEVVDDNINRTGRLNGTQTEQVAAAAGGDVGSATVTLGATGTPNTWFAGDIAVLLYFSAAPSTAQVTQIRRYLGGLCGITVV